MGWVFQKPITSSRLKIYLCHQMSDIVEKVFIHELSCKCLLLPYRGKLLFCPTIHISGERQISITIFLLCSFRCPFVLNLLRTVWLPLLIIFECEALTMFRAYPLSCRKWSSWWQMSCRRPVYSRMYKRVAHPCLSMLFSGTFCGLLSSPNDSHAAKLPGKVTSCWQYDCHFVKL